MIGGNCVATSSVVMKKSVFEKYGGFSCDKELVTVEDYDLWLALLKGNSSVRLINQKLGFYRIHENNSSNVTQYSTAMTYLIEKWAQSVPPVIRSFFPSNSLFFDDNITLPLLYILESLCVTPRTFAD